LEVGSILNGQEPFHEQSTATARRKPHTQPALYLRSCRGSTRAGATWHTSEWLNTPAPLDLEAQRGRVVVACAFQMLCPGCVSHAIPQLKALHELFTPLGVVVVGLHTVFEHHAAMTTTALRAFLHEYRVCCPAWGGYTRH